MRRCCVCDTTIGLAICVLQCVAVCCSVLQGAYVACVTLEFDQPFVCCSVLQCVAVCCSVLQFVGILALHTQHLVTLELN